MSTKTGVAPTMVMVVADATNENAGVMTSSPGPTPTAMSASRSASVPDATPSAQRTPHRGASSRERPPLGAEDEVARVDHAHEGGVQLAAERRVLPGQIDERDHLKLGPLSITLAPILVFTTFPIPSRCSEKRISSSAFWPVAMSLLRLTYSALKAQQSNLKSSPKRLSTNVSVRRSQFVCTLSTRLRQISTETEPCRKWIADDSATLVPGLNVPGTCTK